MKKREKQRKKVEIPEISYYKDENLRLSIIIREYKEELNKIYNDLKKIEVSIEKREQEIERLIIELEKASKMLERLNCENDILKNNIELKENEVQKYKKRYLNLERKYNSLSNSKLGKITLKMWDFRKKDDKRSKNICNF